MAQYRYKIVLVEAHQLAEFNTDATVKIPSWVIDALTGNIVEPGTPDTHWLVKKPNGDYGVYSNEEFEKEFELAELS